MITGVDSQGLLRLEFNTKRVPFRFSPNPGFGPVAVGGLSIEDWAFTSLNDVCLFACIESKTSAASFN